MLKTEFLSDYFLRAPRREACRSAGQRRTRITLHRHIMNLALNKGRFRYSPLFCNRNYSVVIFHLLKEILLRIIFFDQIGIPQRPTLVGINLRSSYPASRLIPRCPRGVLELSVAGKHTQHLSAHTRLGEASNP